MNDLLKKSCECLRDAQRVAILTGAGISAESGIPTFRDALTGLWAKYNPADLATLEAFFLAACHAPPDPQGAVQLDHAGGSGRVMEAIHILRDER